MFQSLSSKLQGVFQKLRGKGTLREQDVAEALRETNLNVSAAARRLGVTHEFLRYRLASGRTPPLSGDGR